MSLLAWWRGRMRGGCTIPRRGARGSCAAPWDHRRRPRHHHTPVRIPTRIPVRKAHYIAGINSSRIQSIRLLQPLTERHWV